MLAIFTTLITVSEGIAASVALLYLKNLKDLRWKFFAYYLTGIFLLDLLGIFEHLFNYVSKTHYYNYLVIPFQFIFLFWLYTRSFKQKSTTFWLFVFLYLISFLPSELYFSKSTIINSFNYTFGCFLLLMLVISEYAKQLYSDDILNFRQNRMFYINLGVTLFYIGTLPFYTFYKILYFGYPDLWQVYCTYTQLSDILMYFLFAASFIWGKQNY